MVQFYPWFNFYFLLFLGMIVCDNEFETKCRGGRGEKRSGGGLKAISDWLDVRAKLFYTEVYKLFYKDV